MALLAHLRSRKSRIALSAHGTDVSFPLRDGPAARLYDLYLKIGARLLPTAIVIANSTATADAATLETTVYGSAANILPIPGSAIARVVALNAGGATIGAGTKITVLFAGISGGMTFCYSGTWLMVLGHRALGGMFAAAGLILLGICAFVALSLQDRKSLLARAFAIRAASLMADTLRQMLAIWSLGAMVGFGEASILTVSSFAGNVLSIVPAGLGVRELVAAALSPVIALPPAVGFLSAAVNRMTGMVGLAVISAILLVRKRNAL